MNKRYILAAFLASVLSSQAQLARITVDAAHPAHAIPPTLWGIFFEDINLSSDGGIYPELVRNRSFEDADTPVNWQFTSLGGNCDAAISTADVHGQPVPLNPFNRRSLRVKANGAFTLRNEGYWGMNIVEGASYTFKIAARSEDFDGTLSVKVLGSTGKVLADGDISGVSKEWKYQTLDLTATGGDPRAGLEIAGHGKGTLFLDMVSLMPAKTWKDHGLRFDLAESLSALRPGFLRFPGGCWVEGDDLAHMYRWKNTIGDVAARTPLWNIWGYYATHGLGYHEYLVMCEDLGAEPLFCINAGMSHKETVPMDKMDQWVQDALDAIEYANGPTNSVWGARRAASGHPAPFNLKFMEIGNENGGPAYRERWPLFVNAIKERYPYMQLVANHWGDGYPKAPAPDIVDEHYYESPESFMQRATQYDRYDRRGPKIFVGEYAVTKSCGLGNLRAALGEAAFMTGLERNSDVVIMASYAPLFVNLNHRAWNPDLINFDSSKWYGLPGYYVQQMFAQNRGDVTLPVKVDSPRAEVQPGKGMIGVGTWNTRAEFKDLKVTAPDGKVLFTEDYSTGVKNWQFLGDGQWKAEGGALQQTAEKEFVRAIAGDRKWTYYTFTLKARKLGGREGFLVLFHINGKEDRTWWNIGGWNNTQNALEIGKVVDPKPGHIETGRWYDIRIEVMDKTVKCYLDGQLVHDAAEANADGVSSLYACASKDKRTGEVILKVVNTSAVPLETEISLDGASLTGKGKATVLSSESSSDENSLENPARVSPKAEAVNLNGTPFKRSFPGNSFTVLRLQSR